MINTIYSAYTSIDISQLITQTQPCMYTSSLHHLYYTVPSMTLLSPSLICNTGEDRCGKLPSCTIPLLHLYGTVIQSLDDNSAARVLLSTSLPIYACSIVEWCMSYELYTHIRKET